MSFIRRIIFSYFLGIYTHCKSLEIYIFLAKILKSARRHLQSVSWILSDIRDGYLSGDATYQEWLDVVEILLTKLIYLNSALRSTCLLNWRSFKQTTLVTSLKVARLKEPQKLWLVLKCSQTLLPDLVVSRTCFSSELAVEI